MKYIPDFDYNYIINKFYDTTKPFNPLRRFIRYDELFEASTGMVPEEIEKEMDLRDEANTNLPHLVRKANAFAFIVDNTRIACDTRDRFPAINKIDRPLDRVIISKWQKEVFDGIKITYEAIIRFIKRLKIFAEKSGSYRMVKTFNNISENAPETFYEAIYILC